MSISTKVVEVMERDINQRPIKASVRDVQSPVKVVARHIADGVEWEPLYGIRLATDAQVPLPHCFSLNEDCLRALDGAA